MNNMKYQIIGLILLCIGGFMAIRPDITVRFQIWTQRVIMGAKFEPSQRTRKAVRFIGVFIVLLGFAIMIGLLKK
jgi:hypothetical protein